jgi:protein-S-isoprenylcysteine O-methyltransferase Ste14
VAGSVRYRIWIAGALAAVALVLAGVAVSVPFMDAPPGGVVGSVATLFIAAEIFAALAIVVVGRELYGKLWAKLQAMRAELSEKDPRG